MGKYIGLIGLLAAALPNMAMAGQDILAQCVFTQECTPGEGCADTTFEVEVLSGTGMDFTIQSMAGDLPGTLASAPRPDAPLFLFATSETAAHLLSIQSDGAARYTLHLQGPLVLDYQGVCKRAE